MSQLLGVPKRASLTGPGRVGQKAVFVQFALPAAIKALLFSGGRIWHYFVLITFLSSYQTVHVPAVARRIRYRV